MTINELNKLKVNDVYVTPRGNIRIIMSIEYGIIYVYDLTKLMACSFQKQLKYWASCTIVSN